MFRSPVTSTTSPVSLPLLLTLCIALLFYLLPWVVNPGLPLTLGGYDLAEWVSLHPLARADGLLTPLLLRLLPVLLVWILALHVGNYRFSRAWWLTAGIVLTSTVALLPPLEFFIQFQDDPNFQQQFILALCVLVGGVMSLSGLAGRLSGWLAVLLAGVGIVVSLLGCRQALHLMHTLQLQTTVGIGGLGAVTTLLVLTLLLVRASIQPAR